MQAGAEYIRDLVFVGGGHSHALALRMLAMRPLAGLRITLVSPASHTPYSGMLPGLVAGHYSFEDTHIDLSRLCRWAGVRFIAAEVTAIDPSARRLSLAGRPALGYDLVSIDIGSLPELDRVPGARAHAVPVKPVAGLWRRWRDLYARVQAQTTGGEYRIAVVGGGAGSVELAMAMALSLRGSRAVIDLWCGAPEILQNYNAGARRAVTAGLARHGVDLHLNARVVQVEDSCLVLADDRRAAYDDLFWCTGAAAAPWIAASGLSTDEAGFLAVRDTLQSLGDDRVFAAGDIATQLAHPRPKAGVYAVRQAPVLAHNLRASLMGQPLREHRPQKRFLSLVSLGDRQATADRGPFNATGGWLWRWKDRIDREFMSRFEDLPSDMPAVVTRLPALAGPEQQAPCGGCGAKVGADTLGSVLGDLAREFPQYCTAGGDDAAPIPDTRPGPVLQSLDLLREIVTDPWQMGRIAANHALSDLYACGATPVSALAAVTLPFAGPALLRRELEQLLAGALHEFAAVDCRLAGGHSMQGPELSVGFVVNGVPLAPGQDWLASNGAVPGDQLLLTKPLGTGALFAAHMQLTADGRDIATATESMLLSNRVAAELAVAHGVSACTDVTGFGLLGHLLEMLGDDTSARLNLERLPLLHGALQQVRAGITSTMHAVNAEAGTVLFRNGSVDEARAQMLFDPQTSGGLLLAVAANIAPGLRDALREKGYPLTDIIGQVVAREDPGQTRVHLY